MTAREWVAVLEGDVDEFWNGRISLAEYSRRNRESWERIDAEGVEGEVLRLIREKLYGRKEG